jgi:putative ABC transport system permease protein
MGRLTDELKLTWRRAWNEPAFTAVVVLTLGLAMGSSAAVLGVVNATFYARLPIRQADRVLRIYASYRKPDGSISQVTVRGREFNVLAQTAAAERGPLAALVGLEDVQVTLTGKSTPQRVTLVHCTPGWMPTLGTPPAAGRWPSSEEESLGEESGVAVISHELAESRFGGVARAAGQTMNLDGRPYSIVGVMPAGFRFPYDAEVWTPVSTPWDLSRDYAVFARLEPEATRQSAQAVLDAAAKGVRDQFPDTAAGFGFSQATLMDNLLENRQGAALALAGVAVFFLLLASANVANLLLARSVTRRREQAIRIALGASRWQMFRGTLVDALALALAGTCAGLLLAAWLGGWLGLLVPSNLSRQLGIVSNSLDARVVMVTAAAGLLAGALSGFLPALRGGKADGRMLIESSPRAGLGRRERWVMDGFVVAQFMLALALLAGAGFMIRNFLALAQRPLGIDAAHLFSMQVSISAPRYRQAAARRNLVRDILHEAGSAPGVLSAGVTTLNPLGDASWWAPVVAEGQPEDPQGSTPLVNHRLVTPELCRTMGIPLLAGRYFTEQDNEAAPPVVLVSARLAAKFFPNAEATGKRLRLNRPGAPWLTVVGVVGDVLDSRDPGAPKETWYLPYAQFAESPAAANVILMARAAGDPRSVQGAVENAVWRVDRDLALFDESTMAGVYQDSLQQDRLSAALISALSAFGLLLAALGIYGALSLMVGERVREIGIRMALGSTPRRVLQMMLGHGLRISLAGLALGLAAAWAMGRMLSRMLTEVNSTDPVVIAGAAGLLLAVALLACYLPAQHAARVDPILALKQE